MTSIAALTSVESTVPEFIWDAALTHLKPMIEDELIADDVNALTVKPLITCHSSGH
jgi:hypothetical protein